MHLTNVGVVNAHPVPKQIHTTFAGKPAEVKPKWGIVSDFRKTFKRLKGYTCSWGRSSSCRINHFFVNTLLHHGGSATAAVGRYLNSKRFGGGRVDSLLYLSRYNRASFYNTPVSFNLRVKAQMALLGFKPSMFSPYSIDEYENVHRINAHANPGPSYIAVGGTTKLDCVDLAWEASRMYLHDCDKRDRVVKPLFSLAGRAKLLSVKDLNSKLIRQEPVGRAVWMADAHESILCGLFTSVMMAWFKATQYRILLGFNKYSDHVQQLSAQMSGFDIYLVVDIKKLDSSERNSVIKRAFILVRAAFGSNLRGKYASLLDRIEEWYIETCLVFPDGEIREKPGGGPSGSDFISIINSIIVAIVVGDILHAMYGPISKGTYNFVNYGDNVIIGVQCLKRFSGDRLRNWGRDQLLHLAHKASTKFGMDFNPLESKVCTQWYVQVGVPKVPVGLVLSDLSSDVLRRTREEAESSLGRRLKPEERIEIIPTEPDGPYDGRTHRWTYVFADSVCWLSYYFKNDGRMIRPTFEVEERLCNPERAPSTLEEYRIMLVNALVENYGNQHTVNRIMHWMYDLEKMAEEGITLSCQAKAQNEQLNFKSSIPENRETLPYTVVEGGRAWYRRQRKIVDLTRSPCMIDFFSRWEELTSKASRVFFGHDPLQSILRLSASSLRKMSGGIPKYVYRRKFRGRKEVKRNLHFAAQLYGNEVYRKAISGPLINCTDPDLREKARLIVTGALWKDTPARPDDEEISRR